MKPLRLSIDSRSKKSRLRESQLFTAVIKARSQYWDFTINPRNNRAYHVWGIFFSLSAVLSAIITPYNIGFYSEKTKVDALFYILQILNMVFFIDIILRFFLHYEERSRWISSHRLIVIHYLKGMFFQDLVSTIPYSLIGISTFQKESHMRWINLAEITKLIKLRRMPTDPRSFFMQHTAGAWLNLSAVDLVFHFLVFLLFTHWIACILGWTALHATDQIEDSWMDSYIDADDLYPINIHNRENQYTLSLYYSVMTLTSIGFGDISPRNRTEYVVSMIVIIAGGFFWAYMIGGLSSGTSRNISHRTLYDNMNYMLKDLHVEPDLARDIREYMLHLGDKNRRSASIEGFSLLTDNLQIKMAFSQGFRARTEKIYYMANLHSSVTLEIFKTIDVMVFTPGERLDRPKTLYIVTKGIAIQKGRIYHKGQSFNHDFICFSSYPALQGHHNAKACSYLQVDALSQDDFYRIINKNCQMTKEDYRLIRYARVLYALINSAQQLKAHGIINNSENDHLRNDAQCTDADHKMGRDARLISIDDDNLEDFATDVHNLDAQLEGQAGCTVRFCSDCSR